MSQPIRSRRNMLRGFLLGAIILIGICVASLWECWYRLPIGEGPAGSPLSRSEFESVWRTQPVLLVGLGDSITAGLGARRGYGYFDRLLADPSEEWSEMQGVNLATVFSNLQFTNLAMSGSTSIEHERRQLPRIPAADSNTLGIVVMTSGGNDLIHNYGRTPAKEGAMFGATWEQAQPWITNYALRIDRMLDSIDDHFPAGCQIFLADIYDPTDGTGSARRVGMPAWPDGMEIHAAYNKIIHDAAEERSHVHLVPLHETFLGHGLTCRQFWRPHYRSADPHYWYWVNLEDPNERGYDAIRRAFLGSLVQAKESLR